MYGALYLGVGNMMSPKNSKKILAVYIQEPNVLTLLQAGKMDPWRTENSIWCDVSRGKAS